MHPDTLSFVNSTKMLNIKRWQLWSTAITANSLFCVHVPIYVCPPASESESDVSPEKRARVGEVPEGEESSSSSSSFSASSSSSSSRSGSKQRSRKRCHRCQTKLELVQQELGSCRCGTMIQLYMRKRILGHTFQPLNTYMLIHAQACIHIK